MRGGGKWSASEKQKAATGQESGGREKQGPAQKDPSSLMKMLLEVLEKDEEQKETVAVLKLVTEKKREETVQMKHDQVKRLGDLWANLERLLKDEEAMVAKLKEQLKTR